LQTQRLQFEPQKLEKKSKVSFLNPGGFLEVPKVCRWLFFASFWGNKPDSVFVPDTFVKNAAVCFP